MAEASFKVNVQGLRKLFAKCQGDEPRRLAEQVVKSAEVAAMFSQAIASNFEQEGPGWKPLKPSTIRSSVSQTIRKNLVPVRSGRKVTGYTVKGSEQPPRQILRRTGLLQKSATTPGAPGHIYKVQGTTIEWGTSLHYAGVHQNGATIQNPGSNDTFGIKGLKSKAHQIVIPARPFLRLSEYWLEAIRTKVLTEYAKAIKALLRGDQ